MRIELTDQQRQVLEHQLSTGAIEVVDPISRRVYILIEREVYERICPLLDHPPALVGEVHGGIEPLMLRSMEAYWRDLPQLLAGKARTHSWVAYYGNEQIGLGKTKTELYQLCLGRGMRRGEFYVGKLQADPDGIPPWGRCEADWSLYEVNQKDEGPFSPSVK